MSAIYFIFTKLSAGNFKAQLNVLLWNCFAGTSMTSLGTCLEPQCQECEEYEYQAQYTRESMCQRQPYCDPSRTMWQIKQNVESVSSVWHNIQLTSNVLLDRNFQVPVREVTKASVCMCEEGFHCSSEECITCVPHTTCIPGYEVLAKGAYTSSDVLYSH